MRSIGRSALGLAVLLACAAAAAGAAAATSAHEQANKDCASLLQQEEGHTLMFLCQLHESAGLLAELSAMVEEGLEQLVLSAGLQPVGRTRTGGAGGGPAPGGASKRGVGAMVMRQPNIVAGKHSASAFLHYLRKTR